MKRLLISFDDIASRVHQLVGETVEYQSLLKEVIESAINDISETEFIRDKSILLCRLPISDSDIEIIKSELASKLHPLVNHLTKDDNYSLFKYINEKGFLYSIVLATNEEMKIEFCEGLIKKTLASLYNIRQDIDSHRERNRILYDVNVIIDTLEKHYAVEDYQRVDP